MGTGAASGYGRRPGVPGRHPCRSGRPRYIVEPDVVATLAVQPESPSLRDPSGTKVEGEGPGFESWSSCKRRKLVGSSYPCSQTAARGHQIRHIQLNQVRILTLPKASKASLDLRGVGEVTSLGLV